MELVVKNVGKISTARMEINGVTVITGYNGSGKSTLCKSLYAVVDSFADIAPKVTMQRMNSMVSAEYQWEDTLRAHKMDENDIDSIRDAMLESIIADRRRENANLLYEEIAKIGAAFSLESSLIDDIVEKCREIREKDKEEYIQFIVSRNVKSIFKNQIGHVNFYKEKQAEIELKDGAKTLSMFFVGNELTEYDYRFGTLKKPIYIEPQSILDSFEAGSAHAIYGRQNSKIQEFLVMDEGFNKEMTLEEYQERERNIKIINEILHEVTHGALVSSQGRSLAYSENGLSENIVCGNIASGLKSFLIIQRMIENGALGLGRLLIIDEPEVNLHPEWQLVFAKILVLLNKELGIKVVISTHSPYFLRAIESYMEEADNCENAKYYLTVPDDSSFYTLRDVSDEKELIYKTMYKPLEEIN